MGLDATSQPWDTAKVLSGKGLLPPQDPARALLSQGRSLGISKSFKDMPGAGESPGACLVP